MDLCLHSSSVMECAFGQVIDPLCILIPSPVTCWCQSLLNLEKKVPRRLILLWSNSKKTKEKPTEPVTEYGLLIPSAATSLQIDDELRREGWGWCLFLQQRTPSHLPCVFSSIHESHWSDQTHVRIFLEERCWLLLSPSTPIVFFPDNGLAETSTSFSMVPRGFMKG